MEESRKDQEMPDGVELLTAESAEKISGGAIPGEGWYDDPRDKTGFPLGG